MNKLIAFFEIPVTDFKRGISFYENVLGCKLNVCEWETEKMAFFTNEKGSHIGALSYAQDFKPSRNGVLIHFHTDEINNKLKSVVQNGGTVLIPKTKIESDDFGYFAVFIDSEGNKIGLYAK